MAAHCRHCVKQQDRMKNCKEHYIDADNQAIGDPMKSCRTMLLIGNWQYLKDPPLEYGSAAYNGTPHDVFWNDYEYGLMPFYQNYHLAIFFLP